VYAYVCVYVRERETDRERERENVYGGVSMYECVYACVHVCVCSHRSYKNQNIHQKGTRVSQKLGDENRGEGGVWKEFFLGGV